MMPAFNTPEYFAGLFADTLSSITDEDVNVDHAIEGFFTALKDAEDYHQDSVNKLRKFRQVVAENLLNTTMESTDGTVPREELTDAELAPPQDFTGPRLFAPKYLKCHVCGTHVKVADKYRRAERANCGKH